MNTDTSTTGPPSSAGLETGSSSTTERWDVIVVGGGAAGLSAALILARARRRVLVIDGREPRNRFAPAMHGVLSRDGYSPLDLVADGDEEVRTSGGVTMNGRVVDTRSVIGGFEVVTDTGFRAIGRHVIVATGARDVLPDIDGLTEQWGRGVVACPYCDGYEATGRAIGVLVASVAGIHKAHMVRSYSADVTVFTALAGPIPDHDRRLLVQRGIRLEDRPIVKVVADAERLVGVILDDDTVVSLDVIFAEPTLVPLDRPLRQLGVERVETPVGLWTSVDAVGRTSVPRVWAVGNAGNPGALVPIAMGSGATAALALNGELIADDIDAASHSTSAGVPDVSAA